VRDKIYIVGMGPGNQDFILPVAQKVIESCDVLIGGKRNLEPFRDLADTSVHQELIEIDHNPESVSGYLAQYTGSKKIAVLVTGDPGIYSLQKLLRQKLTGIEIETIPGISSLQYFCAKLGMSWENLRVISLHGRNGGNLADELSVHRKICVFTGGNNSPDSICRELQALTPGKFMVTVGEKLSYPDERIFKGDLEQIGGMRFAPLAIMLIEQETAADCSPLETSGLPDHCFVRGDVPMTKEEIRAVSLSKLRLRMNDIVYDIGAGTGAVTIEAALRCQNGRVYALEKNPVALALILENLRRFGVTNARAIQGEAPAVLAGLPEPDRVFIGGTGGKLPEIVKQLGNLPKPFRVVINSVTLETTAAALDSLAQNGFRHIETVTVNIARSQPAGGKQIMKAMNPVTVISAEKGA
jgi:precorrin-6Y C5,15-methyltransferase (decarboxylating)